MNKYNVKARLFDDRLLLHTFKNIESFQKLIKREVTFHLYKVDEGYVFVKDYGGIVFFNVEAQKQQLICNEISNSTKVSLGMYEEELQVIESQEKIDQGFDEFVVEKVDIDTVHIISIYLAQSVALFHFQQLSDELLNNTRRYTSELERKGKVSLKRKDLMKYIGSTLNIKNKISENLYIFDSPMMAWQNAGMNKINDRLNEDLEIHYRYKAIQEQVNVIQENLDLFKDINLHNHSSFLEWIIIILILFEVVHVLI